MGQPGDERSDIYSLGIMLYQLVTGRLPYEADTPLAVVLKHINEALPMPRQANPEVPESLERVILKTMAKNPDDRYQHVGDMLNDLKRASGVMVDETPTDTMRARALPAGATAVGTGAVTPFPTAARVAPSTVVGKPSTPTVVTPPSAPAVPAAPARRAGLSAWVIVLIVLAVLFVGAIGVAAVGFINQQNQARALSGTATAQALAAANQAPTSAPTATPTGAPQATPTPSSFVGTVKADNAELRTSPNGQVIGGLPKGTRLTIRGRSSDSAWLKVDAEGTVGWVSVQAIDLADGVSISAIPQAIVLVTPTPPPDLTATAAACKLAAQVTDVSVPDGTQFKPGDAFVKVWRFLNSGNCPWEKNSKLIYQSGDKLGPDSVPMDAAEVGASVDVSMTMKAPQAFGAYKEVWAFQRPSGEAITTMDVSIAVPGPTPTRGPTPTARPASTVPAAATATPGQAGGGAVGPIGSGSLQAGYVGWGNCVPSIVGEGPERAWVWEADFFFVINGGSAGYTIPSNCNWVTTVGEAKFTCRWGGREGTTMVQSIAVSCPGCKPVKVDVSASLAHDSKNPGGCKNQ